MLNEADALPRLLESIAAQSRAPDEIVVVDGGSTDATMDILREYRARLPLKILQARGANISRGRNLAIRAARGDIIASTDAGVRLEPNWSEEIVKPFDRSPQPAARSDQPTLCAVSGQPSAVEAVAGFFVPDPQTVFETALAATTLPVLSDIVPEKFLPSSRSVAFRKRAWEAVGGYPEWLDFCEDLVFDFKLRACYRFVFAPRALVHFRPRSSLRAFFKQYYQYARGDGKANLWLLRHVIRYVTYLVVLPLTLALLRFSPVLGFGILVFGFFALCFTPYKRLLPTLRAFSRVDKLRALLWVPLIRVTGDVAKMVGYPVGVVWRLASRNGVDTDKSLA